MPMIREYHRPTSIAEALELLSRQDVHSAAMGGGTWLNGLPPVTPEAVVDLQAVGLDHLEYGDGALTIGATVTLGRLVDHEMTPAIVAKTARREAPNTIRNAATVGGTIALADWESPLLAALLAYEATVETQGTGGVAIVALDEMLAGPGLSSPSLITSVRLPVGGEFAWASSQRTGSDRPIVAVVGRSHEGQAAFAASGVGRAPRVVDPSDLDSQSPPSDFRGSTEYRRHLLGVLTARVKGELGA